MLTQIFLTVLSSCLLLNSLMDAAPARSSNLVRIASLETGRLLKITDEGYVEEVEDDTCFLSMLTARQENGATTTEFGQIIQGTSYIITAFSDDRVTGGNSNRIDDSGSGDLLIDQEYTMFSVGQGVETQLKMNIEGTYKCLSFGDSPRRLHPTMVDCNGAELFIIDDSCNA